MGVKKKENKIKSWANATYIMIKLSLILSNLYVITDLGELVGSNGIFKIEKILASKGKGSEEYHSTTCIVIFY